MRCRRVIILPSTQRSQCNLLPMEVCINSGYFVSCSQTKLVVPQKHGFFYLPDKNKVQFRSCYLPFGSTSHFVTTVIYMVQKSLEHCCSSAHQDSLGTSSRTSIVTCVYRSTRGLCTGVVLVTCTGTRRTRE